MSATDRLKEKGESSKANEINKEGWSTVTRKKNGKFNTYSRGDERVLVGKVTTLFVENLPDEMDEEWMHQLFSNSGKVIEVFIPKKRSLKQNLRFGFVRLATREEGLIAIRSLNGINIRDHKILVKLATFVGPPDGSRQYSGIHGIGKRNFKHAESRSRAEKGMINHRDTKNVGGWNKDKSGNKASFLEILQGKGASKDVSQTVKIKAREVGNGWLLRSAVAKISPNRSLMTIQEHLRSLGHLDIQVRHMGGDWVVLTFPTREDMLSMLGEGKREWLREWFMEVHKWGEQPEIKYLGKIKVSTAIMEPINEAINLEVNGVLYPVRVCEEQVCNQFGNWRRRQYDGESEADDDVPNEVVDTYEGKADEDIEKQVDFMLGQSGDEERVSSSVSRNVHEMGVSDIGVEVIEWVNKSSSKFAKNGFPEEDVEVGVANVGSQWQATNVVADSKKDKRSNYRTKGVANRNRLILDEAQAAWAIGKILGMEYKGDEDEVVSKMVQMEEQDMEIAGDMGLGKKEKRRRVKKIIRERKVDFVLLQESKMENVNRGMVRQLWKDDNFDFVEVGADGSAGVCYAIGTWRIFSLEEACCNRRFILVKVERREMWSVISKLRSSFPYPWCMGGDFNEIRKIGDRQECTRSGIGMRDFNRFIDGMELYDLPMLGRKYTWSNSQEGEKWSRIDRFLIHPEWLEIFNFKQWGLPRFLSDHSPIILMEDLRDWGPRPFKFINAWVLHPKCLQVMESAWMQSDVQGWAGYRIMRKLKGMKEALKEWNHVYFGNVQTQIEQVEKQLHDLDIKARGRVNLRE
ncbi:hypothetical protein Acr_00g0078180 [Actinidia rufa]|uniref:RRM domain-containing protein n=1 Tax=Actinidia rufa TaxID=165716 RepID=A0A7J0DU24_9ERIC|nr:hypothetical protein Acr_00g0078180 [Actinidia rufa]